jgi:hypothetical protein
LSRTETPADEPDHDARCAGNTAFSRAQTLIVRTTAGFEMAAVAAGGCRPDEYPTIAALVIGWWIVFLLSASSIPVSGALLGNQASSSASPISWTRLC